MTDKSSPNPSPAPTPPGGSQGSSSTDIIKIVYLLYLAGFIVGLTPLIGVVMAYLRRGEADPLAVTHFTFQIRTFWIGLLFIFVGLLTSFLLIGFLLLAGWVVWAIIRNVKGFMLINDGKPVPEPETWLW